ncbi:hypothetical protein BX070DRAFT_219377 [Coemansia spiralis]|nr:hypothetical protein BX070DRAFT_219377 [Coemansia spiralis]
MNSSTGNSLKLQKPASLAVANATSMAPMHLFPSKRGGTDPTAPNTRQSTRHTHHADYSSRGLTGIPREIPVDILEFNLSCNMLTQLPQGFSRTFTNLHTLDISGNQITALPEEISHLHNLRELNASRNALIGLPITIGSLRHLEVLNLAENYIISLDVSLSRLENLRMLDISDNRLTFLPTYLGLLAQNLRILLVDGNPFDKHTRELVEPILTISSKDAKKIAKMKEKAEKGREKALRKGDEAHKASTEIESSLRSSEYMGAIKKLMSVRLKRHRNSSTDTSTKSVTLTPESPNLVLENNSVSLVPAKTAVSTVDPTNSDSMPKNGEQLQMALLPFAPNEQQRSRDSPVLPTPNAVTENMARLQIDYSAENRLSNGNSTLNHLYSTDASTCGTASTQEALELDNYITRQLPPLPYHANAPPLPSSITAESARSAALNLARRIISGPSNNSSMLSDQELLDMSRGYRPRQSSATSGYTILTERASLSSSSQESHGSSIDDSLGLIQDAAKVSRVLWQLCDEWDLDPRHSESDSVENMLIQLQSGNVRMDGASGIERVYREKSPNAGNSQRMKILSELLVTEVTYVDTLKNVVGVYLNPMREAKVLSESELREIFSNIEVILAFHNDHFLPAVTYAISKPEMAIGDVFLHHGAHFKLYSTYTNNHETSVKTLANVSSRRAVSSFIQNARQDVTQIGQVGLDGHLLTPVQRLPRYRMLLIDLLGNTPADHPDHEPLYSALKELNRTIYEVNEKKRTFENQSRLQKIQDKVTSAIDIPLVAPHRVFKLMANFRLQIFSEPIRDKMGGLAVRRIGIGTVYRFFLFNDMIMQCTIIMNKDFRLNRVYRLGSRVTPAEITCDKELRIVDSEGIVYLKGDVAELRKWAREINNRLEC